MQILIQLFWIFELFLHEYIIKKLIIFFIPAEWFERFRLSWEKLVECNIYIYTGNEIPHEIFNEGMKALWDIMLGALFLAILYSLLFGFIHACITGLVIITIIELIKAIFKITNDIIINPISTLIKESPLYSRILQLISIVKSYVLVLWKWLKNNF